MNALLATDRLVQFRRPIAITLAQAGVPDAMLHRLDPAQRLLSDLFAGP